VTVFFGANDSSLAAVNPRQHVPLDEYAANLRLIVTRLKAQCPGVTVVIITPPPICEAALAEGRLKATRSLENAGLYAARAKQLAGELGCPCLDLWTEMQEAAPNKGWHAFLSDGLHLSPEGNKFVGSMLLATIDKDCPHLKVTPCEITGAPGNSGSSSELPYDAPWHNAITDPADFETPLAKAPSLYTSSKSH